MVKTYKGCIGLVLLSPVLLLIANPISFPARSAFRAPDEVRGIVADQDGAPVAGATLVFDEWEHVWFVPIPWTTIPFSRSRSVKTDTEGRFVIEFKRDGLSLSTIDKEGYQFEPTITPKSWSRRQIAEHRSVPHKGSYVLYDLIDIDPSAVRLQSTEKFHFLTNGAEYSVAFETGVISNSPSADADLIFSIKQVEEMVWLLTFRGIDGGLWACANEMPYAPTDGYLPGFSALYGQGYAISYRAQYAFFAKTQNGKHHSRVIADIVKKKQTVQFHYVVNLNNDNFLFVPERVDARGIHGPPHCEESYHNNTRTVILGEGKPWWREQGNHIYPMVPEKTFFELMTPNGKNQSSRLFTARQIYAPVAVLEELSLSAAQKERWDVAQNPAAPREILLRLSADSQESVRREADKTLARASQVEPYLRSKGYFRTPAPNQPSQLIADENLGPDGQSVDEIAQTLAIEPSGSKPPGYLFAPGKS